MTDLIKRAMLGSREAQEEITAVFNDAVLFLGLDENRELKVKFVFGEPYRFDFNVFEEE